MLKNKKNSLAQIGCTPPAFYFGQSLNTFMCQSRHFQNATKQRKFSYCWALKNFETSDHISLFQHFQQALSVKNPGEKSTPKSFSKPKPPLGHFARNENSLKKCNWKKSSKVLQIFWQYPCPPPPFGILIAFWQPIDSVSTAFQQPIENLMTFYWQPINSIFTAYL